MRQSRAGGHRACVEEDQLAARQEELRRKVERQGAALRELRRAKREEAAMASHVRERVRALVEHVDRRRGPGTA